MTPTEDINAARAQQEALKRLARPVERAHGPRADLGDGDPCPLDPAHGRMYVLKGSGQLLGIAMQWCAHSNHEACRGKDGRPDRPTSRAHWPFANDAFAEAVRVYTAREA